MKEKSGAGKIKIRKQSREREREMEMVETRKSVVLARISFPPNRRHSNVRPSLHRLSARHACRIQHCLFEHVRGLLLAASPEWARDETNLGTRKVMVSGDGRGILVESGLPIISGIVWEMRKVKESWFFGLVLFLHVGGVHLLRLSDKDAIHAIHAIQGGCSL